MRPGWDVWEAASALGVVAAVAAAANRGCGAPCAVGGWAGNLACQAANARDAWAVQLPCSADRWGTW